MDEKQLRTIIGQRQERQFTLTRAELVIDEANRTLEISFSSEFPVERYFGIEILDHSPESVMLDRINSSGAYLNNHNTDRKLGWVMPGSARVENDRKNRCKIRYSRRPEAENEWQDVLDDAPVTISVGYIIHDLVLEKSDDDGRTYRVTKWEPLEVSAAPVPADITVGGGRALDTPQPIPPAPTRATNQPTIEVRNAMDPILENAETTSADMVRANEILGLGRVLEELDLARDFIADDKTPAEFKAAVKDKRKVAQVATPAEDAADVALRNGGTRTVQVLSRHGKLKNFKGEGAELRAYRFGMWGIAALMGRNGESPLVKRAREYCRTNGLMLERAATESINEDGGFNVPTEFGNDLIDLREEYGDFRPNTRVVPMASDSKTEPRRTGGLTAYAVGETAAITESQKGWDQVKLVAKEWGVLAKTSSAHNEDTVINWADDTMGEIAYAFAQKEDDCGFNADGTSAYHGIVGVRAKLKNLSATIANIAGLVVASGNLFSEFVLGDFLAVKGRLPAYAYKRDKPKWFVHQTFWNEVMERLALAAGGAYAAEIVRGATGDSEPTFLGYPVAVVQSMPRTDANSQVSALFGSLRLASMLGDRKGTELAMTDSDGTDFASRILSIRGITRWDIIVHDVGNAHATAASRVPGPIVGLISAAS